MGEGGGGSGGEEAIGEEEEEEIGDKEIIIQMIISNELRFQIISKKIIITE